MTLRVPAVLLLLVSAIGLGGCASDGELDALWRQGYGYNNPNAERMRQG